MKKDIKIQPALFPMPVLLIATYDDQENVDVMNMAWGGIYDEDGVILNLSSSHKTTQNIKEKNAFTLGFATVPLIKEADYFGMVSGNHEPDKFKKSHWHAFKSSHIDAPILEELPVSLECIVEDIVEHNGTSHIIGRIVHVLADEEVLNEKGRINSDKLQGVVFDGFHNRYLALGKEVGKAWDLGKEILKNHD